MYQDDSDWRLLQDFGKMYPDSPLAADIAGTPATINAITADDLYKNYEVFYHPKNMNLFLTGPFDIEMMADFVRNNQAKKDFANLRKLKEKKLLRVSQLLGNFRT